MRWMGITLATGFVAALLAGGSATAGDMAVGEFVGAESQSDCMERARRAAQEYRDRFGASAIVEDTWTVYLFNAEFEGFDIVIMCPIVGGETASFIVVHGEEGSGPLDVLSRMQQVWN